MGNEHNWNGAGPALTKFDALPMNAHGLRRVHLDLPPTLLARADEVVE